MIITAMLLSGAHRRPRRAQQHHGPSRPLHRRRRSSAASASPASPSPCSAATTRSASPSPPCCGRSWTRSRRRCPTPSCPSRSPPIMQGDHRAVGGHRLRGRPPDRRPASEAAGARRRGHRRRRRARHRRAGGPRPAPAASHPRDRARRPARRRGRAARLRARLGRSPAGPLARYLALGVVVLSLGPRRSPAPSQLTAESTFRSALQLSMPIALAGLGGLWAERAGVVNIGLEGMMVLGTWFGACGGIEYGPWQGVLLGVVGGAARRAAPRHRHRRLRRRPHRLRRRHQHPRRRRHRASSPSISVRRRSDQGVAHDPRATSARSTSLPFLDGAAARTSASQGRFFLSDLAARSSRAHHRRVAARRPRRSLLFPLTYWSCCGGRRSACGSGRSARTPRPPSRSA